MKLFNNFTDYILLNAAGVTLSGVSAGLTLPEFFYVDAAVIFAGALLSMSQKAGIHSKLWNVLMGICAATGVAVILRSTELAEWQIRSLLFVSAVLGIQVAYYIRNPEEGIKYVLTYLSGIKKILKKWLN